MKRAFIAGALLALVTGAVLHLGDAQADEQKLPQYVNGSAVVRTEELAPRADTTRCVRAGWASVRDAGVTIYLGSQPDAAYSPGPDAAIWQTGGDAAVWIPPDAGPTGAPPKPSADLPYVCTSRGAAACWRQRSVPADCTFTSVFPQDAPFGPFMFMPEPDGGLPVVFGTSASATTPAEVECCPYIEVTARGR